MASLCGCRLQTLVNYALKAERDLWGVLDGPWDGPDYANHRRAWSLQVRQEGLPFCMQTYALLQLDAGPFQYIAQLLSYIPQYPKCHSETVHVS